MTIASKNVNNWRWQLPNNKKKTKACCCPWTNDKKTRSKESIKNEQVSKEFKQNKKKEEEYIYKNWKGKKIEKKGGKKGKNQKEDAKGRW